MLESFPRSPSTPGSFFRDPFFYLLPLLIINERIWGPLVRLYKDAGAPSIECSLTKFWKALKSLSLGRFCCGQLWVRHMICSQTCDELYHLYSEIDQIHLSSEAQCVSHHLPQVDCHKRHPCVVSNLAYLKVASILISYYWLLPWYLSADDHNNQTHFCRMFNYKVECEYDIFKSRCSSKEIATLHASMMIALFGGTLPKQCEPG